MAFMTWCWPRCCSPLVKDRQSESGQANVFGLVRRFVVWSRARLVARHGGARAWATWGRGRQNRAPPLLLANTAGGFSGGRSRSRRDLRHATLCSAPGEGREAWRDPRPAELQGACHQLQRSQTNWCFACVRSLAKPRRYEAGFQYWTILIIFAYIFAFRIGGILALRYVSWIRR